MNDTPTLPPDDTIEPLRIAGRLKSIHDCNGDFAATLKEEPRWIEALWFLQWQSMQPGGLSQFVADWTTSDAGAFVTKEMKEIGIPRAGRYNIKQCREAWLSVNHSSEVCLENSLREILDSEAEPDWKAMVADGVTQKIVGQVTPERLAKACRTQAVESLPAFLARLCTDDTTPFDGTEARGDYQTRFRSTWFMHDFPAALFACMERHASRTRERLADTAVVVKVFDALDYLWHTRGFVTITGNSRFGKTEVVKAWCEMYPGRLRYFAVPSEGEQAALLRAVASALGLSYTWKTPLSKLTSEVGFVVQFGGIGLVADEGQFMVPARITKLTKPQRLNWFRTRLVDNRVPCALCMTAQFRKELDKFVSATGYVVEQFLGRPKLEVRLPEALEDQDLLNVARHYLPGFKAAFHLRVCGRAKAAPKFLQAMGDIADLARYRAMREGRDKANEADVEGALNEILPSLVSAARNAEPAPEEIPQTLSCERAAAQPQSLGRRPAAPLRSRFAASQLIADSDG